MSDHTNIVPQLTKTKEQVEWLLWRYPAARDNDFYLIWMWLRTFAKINLPYLEFDVIREHSGTMETITRVRRTIQNTEGKYPPSDEVRLRRAKKRDAMRKAFGEDLGDWSDKPQ